MDQSKEDNNLVARLRQLVYKGFYVLKQKSSDSRRFYLLNHLVMFLQWSYFPLMGAENIPAWLKSWLGTMSAMNDFGFAGELILLVTLLTTFGVGVIGFGSLANHESSASFGGIIHLLFRLFQLGLQVPTTVMLSRVAKGDLHMFDSLSESFAIVVSVIGLILFIIVTAITSVFALLVYHELPFEKDGKVIRTGVFSVAMPHGRVECATTLLRALSLFAYIEINGQTDFNVSLLVVSLGLLTICGLYGYFLPFFFQDLNSLFCLMYGWLAYASTSVLLSSTLEKAEPLTLMLVPTPFILISINALTQYHVNLVKATKGFPHGVYQGELKLRLLHFTRVLNGEPGNGNEEGIQLGHFVFGDKVEEDYRELLKVFPVTRSAFPYLFVASLATRAGNRLMFALNLLTQSKKTNLPIDHDFYLFCHNKLNQKNQQDNSGSGAASYIMLDHHLAEAKTSLIQTLKHTASFWRKISNSSCSLGDLLSHGSKVHQEAVKCRFHLGKLRKLSHSNKQALKLQSLFFFYVMNDKETAINIEFEIQKNNYNNAEQGFAVCTISGDPSTLGRILDLNQGMCEMFGYSKGDLVGHNVNVLCPPPFEVFHDRFLQQFISMDSEFSTQIRRIWGMHAKGHILLVDFEVTPSTNENSELILIGRFTKVPQGDSTHLILCDATTHAVTAFSQNAPNALGLDESEVFAMTFKVTDILPDFFKDEYKTERQISINGAQFVVKAKFVQFKSKADSPVNFDVQAYVVTFTMQQERVAFSYQLGSLDHSGEQQNGDDDDGVKDDSMKNRGPLLGGAAGEDNRSVKSANSRLRKQRGRLPFDQSSHGSNTTGGYLTAKDLEISKIQRRILSKMNNKDKDITRFDNRVKVFILAATIYAVLQCIYQQVHYNTFLEEASELSLLQASAQHLLSIATATAYMYTFGSGVDTNETGLIVNIPAFLGETVEDLKYEHKAVADNWTPIIEAQFALHEPKIGVSDGRHLSYYLSVLEFVSNVESLLHEANFTSCKQSCSFVISNCKEIQESALEISKVIHSISFMEVEALLVYELVILCIGATIALGVLLLIYVPMLQRIEQRRGKVGKGFMNIPTEVTKSLQSRTEKRLSQLVDSGGNLMSMNEVLDEAAENAANEDDDEGTGGYGMVGSGSVKHASFNKRTSQNSGKKNITIGLGVTPENSEQPVKKPTKTSASSKVSPEKHPAIAKRKMKRDPIRKRLENFVRSTAQTTFSLWVFFLFLGVNYLMFNRQATLENYVGKLYVAGERMSALDLAFFHYIQNETDLAKEYVQVLKDQNFKLKFGDSDLHIVPFAETSGPLYDLYFENACDEGCELSDDVQFVDKLRNGLQLALERYMTLLETGTLQEPDLAAHHILVEQMIKGIDAYKDVLRNEIDSIGTTRIVVTVCFVGLMLISRIITNYAISALDRELKKSQTLLLMLPCEVFQQVHEIAQLIQEK